MMPMVQRSENGQTINRVGKLFEHNTTLGSFTKHYLFGGKLIAMREGLTANSAVSFFATDHLGSTNATLWANGSLRSRLRYDPWGKERYAQYATPSGYRYTSQRWDSGLGLYDYNARYYDPALGKFISADILVPNPTDPQSLNRYSYTRNSPINFSDPTGHCRYNDQGEFEYAINCTVEEFDTLSWDDRILWMNTFMENTGAEWFHNINGILEFFRDDPVFSDSAWASYSDAAVLAAIQDGWRSHISLDPIGTGGTEWEIFFNKRIAGAGDAELLQQWGVAEQSGVNYGVALAEPFADGEDLRESLQIETFVGFGNFYRTLVSSGFVFETAPVMTPLFDPRTPTSHFFVREFSQNVIIPTSNSFYFNVLRSQNPFGYGFGY